MTLEEAPRPTETRGTRGAGMPPAGERQRRDSAMTSGLAWCNIAVGLSQLVAPDALARLIGLRPSPHTRMALRAVGIREITTGYALLADSHSTPWLWSRLAGDAMDLSLLVAGVGRRADDRTRATRTAFAIASGAVVNVYAAARTGRSRRRHPITSSRPDFAGRVTMPVGPALAPAVEAKVLEAVDNVHVALVAVRTAHHMVTVSRPAADLYAYWRDFENLPSFMRQLESVVCADGARSHWVMRAPGGSRHSCETEIVADVPGELIAWRTSLPDTIAHSAAIVHFLPTPSGRDTTVHLTLEYTPSAGALGEVVARLFGVEPSQQLETDLSAFKQLMEMEEGARACRRNALRTAVPPGDDSMLLDAAERQS